MTLTVAVLSRETLLLQEGEDWLRIRCAWGVDPSIAFLPSPATWELSVPRWLAGRRDEATAAIEEFGLHVVSDDQPLSPLAAGRGKVTHPSADPVPDSTTLPEVSMDELRGR